jgi:sulfur-oxidizing protein SoxY
MNRRQFNKSLGVAAAVSAGASMGLLPVAASAAWPTSAFDAESMDDALNALYGTTDAESSDAISFKAPDIAENGAVVPISISVDMPNVEHVALLVENNPSPLAATFEIPTPGPTTVGTRIKMGKTSPLIAMVKADGKLYKAVSKDVKVTIGGCGG